MFKKALKIAVTFCLLVGAYNGYTRLFAIVVDYVGPGGDDDSTPFAENESSGRKRAAELARESFGPDHFAARDDLKLQYYEGARGFYMYAQHKEISPDGKTIKVSPFAVIWESKDGRSRKIATSDEAIIDMSQPFMSMKPTTGQSKVMHARMIGNVRLRDDKGTRDVPTDDLHISLDEVEFDDEALQITSPSPLFLRDRDTTLTGIGLVIQLRRKQALPDSNGNPLPGEPSGYDPETVTILRDIHVVVNNATADGVLPGTAKPEKTGKTPIDVRSDREMWVGLPKPRPQTFVGPPYLDRTPDPTFVKFKTNVVVTRGTDKADQLNCDTLDLTLRPDPRKPASEADLEQTPEPSEGPLTEQKIRVALARGDAVWLQSEAQGMIARCVELKYEKHGFEGKPDITYLNGGWGKKLMVEKVEYDAKAPTPGTIKSIMRLTALDATIFEAGNAGGSTKVIARGPGNLKERPARNASIKREVWFEDEMEMLTWHDGWDQTPAPSPLAVRSLNQPLRPEIPRGTLRRLLTLSGVSKLVDVETSTTLDARKTIVAEFQAEPGCDVQVLAPLTSESELPTTGKNLVVVAVNEGRVGVRVFDRDGKLAIDSDETSWIGKATEIEALKAQIVGLKLPRTLTPGEKGRMIAAVTSIVAPTPGGSLPVVLKDGPDQIKWLDAFEDAHLTAPSKILTARLFLKAKFEQAPPPPPPTVVAGPVPAMPGPMVAASPVPAPLELTPKPEPEVRPIKVEPLVDGRADRVWATVVLGATPADGSGKTGKGELKDAQLRGGVMVHQDPQPGKPFGSDASGEALDLTNQGDGLMKFVVKREEPQASDPKTRLASSGRSKPAWTYKPAHTDFDGKTIESDDIIGVDQKANFAWSQGAGVFTQMSDRGLLDDKGIEGEKTQSIVNGKLVVDGKPAGPAPQDRLAISWNQEMRFYGQSKDLEGRPAAKIEFRGESHDVRTPDGRREFRRGVEARMTESAIYGDTMDVYMDRTIELNRALNAPKTSNDPNQPKAQVAMLDCKGLDIIEDAAIVVPGVVIVSQKLMTEEPKDPLKEKYRIEGTHVIYDKRTGNFHSSGAGMVWIYRRKENASKTDGLIPTASLTSNPSTSGRTRPDAARIDKPLAPLELTKIRFDTGMQGRFGVARDRAETERRDAEFVGNVQAANATVISGDSDLDFDRLGERSDSMFLTSEVLNVFSIPMPKGSKSKAKQLLDAKGNAQARTAVDTIQADRITYNTDSALAYAYGYDGKEVSVVKQEARGQRPSPLRGKSLVYNNNTHQSQIVDPHSMSFTDLKSGIRAKAFFPDLGGSAKPIAPKPLKRVPLQRQGRVSTERSGFTGH